MSAIHHGLAVMKHEVPGDMASYIIHRIQQESGPGDFSANSGKQKNAGISVRPSAASPL